MTQQWLGPVVAGCLAIAGCGESDQSVPDASADTAAPSPATATAPAESAPAPTIPRGLDKFDLETFKVVYRHDGSETGTSTLWVEDYGERAAMDVDIVTKLGNFEQRRRQHNYWDGERVYMHDLEADSRFDTVMRPKDMEPAAFAVTSSDDLVRVGYERIGDLTIAGQTCEHWRNDSINYEACRWKRIELMSKNAALAEATGGLTLQKEAVELVEGEGIPEEFKSLAD